jgi:hypothetical protein
MTELILLVLFLVRISANGDYMLGKAKSALGAAAAATPDYAVFISPSNIIVFTGNGAATSPLASTNVTGGTPPYTYSWSVDNPLIGITSPTSEETTFTASGWETEILGVATLMVTDDVSAEVMDTVNINFNFSSL